MAAVASFAASPQGQTYALVCDRWGVDPAAAITDDVLAYNLRAALMLAMPARREAVDEWDEAGQDFEQQWKAAAR